MHKTQLWHFARRLHAVFCYKHRLIHLHRYCFALGDVAEDYAAVAAGKLPKPKVGALAVLRDAIAGAPPKEAAKVQALLAPPLAKAAMEPAPDVREAALQVKTNRPAALLL